MIDFVRVNKNEIRRLLTAKGELQQELFRRARTVRSNLLGDGVLLRGVIEISSFCQKQCNYCAMRASNPNSERYRMSVGQILDTAGTIKEHGIDVAFLQAGQDRRCDGILREVIPVIRRDFGMQVLLNVGERPKHVYQEFAELGAESYILKFETSSPRLYEEIAQVSPERRLECTEWIQEVGMKLGTGNIVGLPGQELEDMADDICFAASLRPDFVSSAPFIPNQNTPYENHPCGDVDLTLNTMAIWRILLGTPLIPAVSALEKLRPDGQLHGLNAGANVLTINFTPSQCRKKYAIYSKQRFVVSFEHALKTIERAGLTRSSHIASAPAWDSCNGDSSERRLQSPVLGVADAATLPFGLSDVQAAV